MTNKKILLLLLIIIAVFIIVCTEIFYNVVVDERVYNGVDINNPQKITMPIDNFDKALQYSLSLESVKTELNKPLEGRMAEYNKYGWWAKVLRMNEYPYDSKNAWAVTWFKGPGECNSPHGCQIVFDVDGKIIHDLSCSDVWSCM